MGALVKSALGERPGSGTVAWGQALELEDVFNVRTGTRPGSMFPQGRYWTWRRVLLPSAGCWRAGRRNAAGRVPKRWLSTCFSNDWNPQSTPEWAPGHIAACHVSVSLPRFQAGKQLETLSVICSRQPRGAVLWWELTCDSLYMNSRIKSSVAVRAQGLGVSRGLWFMLQSLKHTV